jgi:hypothetical protein
MTMKPPVDPLDELLNRCQPAPEPPAQLIAKVRRRLAERRAPAWPAWVERLDAVFARPSFAAAFVTACLLLGLFLAETRVSRLHQAQSAQVARSYVRLINPLFGPTPVAPPAAHRSP